MVLSSLVLSDQQFAVGQALGERVILQENMQRRMQEQWVQQTPPIRGDRRGLLDALSCVGNDARSLYKHRVLYPHPGLVAGAEG
jgi:hypothetical protein